MVKCDDRDLNPDESETVVVSQKSDSGGEEQAPYRVFEGCLGHLTTTRSYSDWLITSWAPLSLM
jgi:hypothetical protein